ncbi:MAG: transglutaminase family protein [Polyangiales bacterium]
MNDALLADVQKHDLAVARSGLKIWIGSEPTFTNARSQQPCWISEASGGEKEAHAQALLAAIAPRLPGPVQLLRVPGRLYPGETEPRFCYGALFGRRGAASGVIPSLQHLESGELAPMPVLDESQAWLTVTPDPAVVEVNMAPAPNLSRFARWVFTVYAAAEEAGLSATRYRYNGDITDSGGGGQITLGGPSPERSPFFLRPQLLPSLVRYANRHPSLSYLFAPACCGSASQGPRADEGVRERFDELPLALDYLAARGDAATPEELWGTLGPLLVDATGCAHRAELNIEKLWNPSFAGRGQLGLVELRALRMPSRPERLIALAALFRAIAARLAKAPYYEPLADWGSQLHDAISLPWNLERDLEQVLNDLDAHGFGLGRRLRAELIERPEPITVLTHHSATLELQPAISFWPLLGDAAGQAAQGARWVDSSAQRVQVLVTAPRGTPLGEVGANGCRVPLQPLTASAGQDRALGSVVYRAFVPVSGLHPAIAANDPWVLEWHRGGTCLRAEVHSWLPGGGLYDGLPRSPLEAHERRQQRVVLSSGTPTKLCTTIASGSLDLRYLNVDRSRTRPQLILDKKSVSG